MLSESQKQRYARHLLLPQFGEKAQEKLLNSKVLLIGAGGLGSPCALYLAAAGVGHLTIIDHDSVDLSNLQRQILHRESDVGISKLNSAQRELNALNSGCKLTLIDQPFSIDNAEALVKKHDLVIDGSDNFSTRFLANDACFLTKTPLIYGSIFQFEGQLTVFDSSPKSPCYRCIVPDLPEEGAVPNCLEAGVIGTLPGIIGSMQAMEAIKYLTNLGRSPIGKLLYYDALDTSFREIMIKKDEQCPLCSTNATIKVLNQEKDISCEVVESISAAELKTILSDDIILVDVREAKEYAIKRIPGSQLIPLSELNKGLTPRLPKESTIYVHCKAGSRSLKAIKILEKQGYHKLINIYDGIDAFPFKII